MQENSNIHNAASISNDRLGAVSCAKTARKMVRSVFLKKITSYGQNRSIMAQFYRELKYESVYGCFTQDTATQWFP